MYRRRETVRVVALALPLLVGWSAVQALAGQRFDVISRGMHRLVDEQQLPSVVVAVAKDGRIIWEEGAGWADRERHIPTTPHTPYSVASISKPFTATAVMKLVEAGRIALDRAANDYLDGARITGKRPDRATVRRVLSHTAGLPPYYRMRSDSALPAFEDTIARRAILRRPPGRRYVYSNLGYGILGHIIERASGASYEEFMRREIFEPLGLATASAAPGAPPHAAVRYNERGAPLPFYDLDHRAASAVYASARDLVRFGMFHLNESQNGAGMLTPESIREMQRIHAWVAPREGYGLGWRVDEDDLGFRHVGHTGGMPGVTTALSLFPSERVVVVVLANGCSDHVLPLARRVAGVAIPQYGWRLRQLTR